MGFSWGFIEFGTPDFDCALALRDIVLRKPLGLEFHSQDIALEFDQFHLGAFAEDGTLLGVMTLQDLHHDHTIKMRQVAVTPDRQSQGIGSYLVHVAEIFCRQKGYQCIVLHARDTAIPFYKRLHYQPIGEEFYEVNILHQKMEKTL